MHSKRSSMPAFWPVARKTKVWAVVTGQGPHSKKNSIPLGVVVRDVLKLTPSLTEAKKVINEGRITVNGTVRKGYRFPIGTMDLVEIPDTKSTYRVTSSHSGLDFEETKDTSILCKITNKTAVRKGKTQYTTHNGLTLLAESKYRVRDTLRLDSKRKITGHFRFEPGSSAIITGGRLRGTTGKIKEIGDRVSLETKEGMVETIRDYIFVTGEK